MLVNSKFSGLYLGRKESWKSPFDQDVCYIQKFAQGDEIRLQFVTDHNYTAKCVDSQGIATSIPIETIRTEGYLKLQEVVFSIVDEGLYEFRLEGEVDEISTMLAIESPEKLKDTILLSYTHRRDEYDTIFTPPLGDNRLFHFRVEGGIYPGGKVQGIENEIFRDQRYTPYQTAAESYEISELTIGSSRGVPQWVGNKMNHIFKLSDVYVDGILTTRNESSIPELVSLSKYYPLYVFRLKVEQSDKELASNLGRIVPVLGTESKIIVHTEDNKNYIRL